MDSQESRPLLDALCARVGDPGDAGQTALLAAGMWREISRVLAPVLGERGVTAIYRRSLFLTTAYPILVRIQQDIDGPIDVEALSSALREQNGADACAAARALLESFYSLLTTLIGAALTERLFRIVLTNSTTKADAPSEDSSPWQK